jgi:vitamin B12 transporter
MNNSLPFRFRGRFSVICGAVSCLAGAHAQTIPAIPPGAEARAAVQLSPYVVSATRVPTDPRATPSVVTVVNPQALALAQTPDLAAALARVPGLSVARTGAVGGPTSIFIRGASSEHTLWLVDGIRMNTGDADYTNFLGAADYAGVGRLEVLRGAQSTLYGSSALGGVILVDTATGSGPASGTVSATAGSFGTVGGGATVQGGTAGTGYSASLSTLSTQNDRAYNDFSSVAYSSRVETRLTPTVLAGVTVRGLQSSAEAPGSVVSKFSGDTETKQHLATFYLQVSPVEAFRTRLTYGWVQREYTYDPFAPPVGDPTDTDFYGRNTRNVLDWQNTWEAAEWLSVVAGLNVETERITSVTPSAVNRFDNDSQAGYLSANLRPVENLNVLAGVRRDDFDRFGGATTWRTGASYYITDTSTKVRANYGTGFNAPRPVYVLGGPSYTANPSLRPEESEGWDAGIDQELVPGKATLGVTYFSNTFTNLFIYDFTVPGILNIGRASARGVETALRLTPSPTVTFDLAYTYLDATNDVRGVPLVRRPRHVLDAEAGWQATPLWRVGSGVRFAARRFDGTANKPVRVEDYTTVRLFTQYQFPRGVLAKLRVENLLDERYAEIRNYPSLPRAVYGSVEWRF